MWSDPSTVLQLLLIGFVLQWVFKVDQVFIVLAILTGIAGYTAFARTSRAYTGMMLVGLVSLPGMMTGQLVSGVEPIEAVTYQIVIMFLIASATALGSVSVVLLAYRRLFTAHHQFRYDQLRKRP